MSFLKVMALAMIITTAAAGAGQAALRICNDADDMQSVAMGYQKGGDWVSLGWWNIEPGDCAVTVGGDLENRYYYYRAEIDGGRFDGNPDYTFCTDPKVFEIVGDGNCEARGYETETFAEIDTGPAPADFTFRLTASGGGVPSAGGEAPAAKDGLQVCNDTRHAQSVAIGFQRGSDWVSAGWWNLEPGECKMPLTGALQNRYYYYRAEIDGGRFDGNPDYTFCTDPKAFEIVGDTNCEGRGYATETFAEIDTGPSASAYTLRLDDVTGGRPPTDSGAGPSAETGLEFCNDTAFPQSVALGMQRGDEWVSAGWWVLEPGECSRLLSGALQNRYYYYRAEIGIGGFAGDPDYTFCTTSEAFEIVGDGNCEGRGYVTRSFAEIDTGPEATGYTFRLTAATGGTPPASGGDGGGGGGASGAEQGLTFCNQTAAPQSIAVAYARDGAWVSLGWWNVAPAACATPLPRALTNQYYYYRAEGPDGAFRGEGYRFCTTPEAFEITGDTDCEARGYEIEDFREIDTGERAAAYTVVLDAASTGTGGSISVTPGAGGRPPTGFVFETEGGEGGSEDGRFKRKPPRR